MKRIHQWLDRDSDHSKPKLTKKAKVMLTGWALEAYKLDQSLRVDEYYDLFLNKLRSKYSKETIDKFFKLGVIEV